MTSSDGATTVAGSLDATEETTALFELLSDETRVAIVGELARQEGLRFSTLRERVGTADSGQFNYHLERLRGRLVRKSGEGYELTPQGRSIADAVLGRGRG